VREATSCDPEELLPDRSATQRGLKINIFGAYAIGSAIATKLRS
jgi:hypothetical protein